MLLAHGLTDEENSLENTALHFISFFFIYRELHVRNKMNCPIKNEQSMHKINLQKLIYE